MPQNNNSQPGAVGHTDMEKETHTAAAPSTAHEACSPQSAHDASQKQSSSTAERTGFTGFGSYAPGQGPVAAPPRQSLSPGAGHDHGGNANTGYGPVGAAHAALSPLGGTTAINGGSGNGGGNGAFGGGSEFYDRSSSGWTPLVAFGGKGLDYFVLLLQNTILAILTMGIYSFWGKAKVRQYLWQNTTIFGEPLEYTGTGKELFISFLIVMPVFIVLIVAVQVIVQYFPIAGQIAWSIIFIYLWQYATYRSLRYRLTRTRWRGIRCNLAGNAASYAWKGTLYFLLMILSFGLLTPFSLSRMISLKLNNMHFGARKLHFHGSPGGLYKAIMLPFMGMLIFMALFVGAILMLAYNAEHAGYYSEGVDEIEAYVSYFPLALVAGLIGLLLFSSFLQAAFTRWLFRHMQFGDAQTRSTLMGAKLLGTYTTNLLLVLFTFGIGRAWAEMRLYRATLNSIDYTGDPSLHELLQDTIEAPKYGEGLLEALDVDIAF